MSLKIAILMDPISGINIKKDSSFAILLAAQANQHELYYLEMNDLFLDENNVKVHTKSLKVEK